MAVEDNHVVPHWRSCCGDGRMTHTWEPTNRFFLKKNP